MVAARSSDNRQPAGLWRGWRGLGRFWLLLLFVLGIGAATLEVLGPSPQPAMIAVGPIVHADPRVAKRQTPIVNTDKAPRSASPLVRPGKDTAGPIADPDPSLQEPYPDETNLTLPRISPSGRAPMAAYAAGFDPSSLRPRVGILIAGIGMSGTDSLTAIKDLPPGVTLAISPYAIDIAHILALARMTEHEYLLSVPMEPQGYPVNDPDDRHALMTSLPPAENLGRLRWVLSRLSGYVGITSAMGQMHGERLAGVPDQFDSVLEEAANRGLLFIDGTPGSWPLVHAWSRSVDMVVDDDQVDAAALDQRLDALSHLALDKGSALGLVSLPRPVTLARVAAWTTTLTARGLALAPVSALVLAPAKQEPEK